jgi:cell division protein FtsA
MAGRHVTQDIAQGLSINLSTAERLKTLYGGVMATEVDKFDVVPLSPRQNKRNTNGFVADDDATDTDLNDTSEGGYKTIPRSHLIAIIRPRIEEILEISKDALEKAGFSCLPKPHVVFTGGACQIPGLLECAQKTFGYRVRIGRPAKINGLPLEFLAPSFSTLAGLAHYAMSSRQKTSETIMDYCSRKNSGLDKIKHWFVENW